MLRLIGRLAGIGMLVVALLAPSAVALAASGTNRYVNPAGGVVGCPAPAGKTYNTILAAVTAAGKGDTVFVCPGTYAEDVSFSNKTKLTIRNYVVANQPPPTITPPSAIAGFEVFDSSEVTIQGLHITGARFGVFVSASPKTTVQKCLIDTGRVGIIFLPNAVKGRALKNTITNMNNIGLALQAADSAAEDNIVNGAATGIYLLGTRGAKIRHNTLINNRQDGITLSQVTASTISDNMASFNGWNGIDVGSSANNTIKDNTLKGNGLDGIHSQLGSAGNTYSKNTLQGNQANDAEDSDAGSGTAGTANTWKSNKCDVSFPGGLCASAATRALPRAGVPSQ
jgi:parallel beta-helix repeat protein